MSQSAIKKLIAFLLISFVLGVALLLSLIFKTEEVKPQSQQSQLAVQVPPPVHIDLPKPSEPNLSIKSPQLPNPNALTVKQQISTTPVVVNATQSATTEAESKQVMSTPQTTQVSSGVPVSVPAFNPTEDKVCVVYGPLDIEKKSTMDVILNKFKQSNLAKVDKKVTYLIYWNLGQDKKEAEKLFDRLKNNGGALSDPKFVLTKNDNGDYVVNIIRVNSGKAVAEKLTNDLINKGNKVKIGGQWQYKALPEGYFYTFPDYTKLNTKAIDSINIMIDAPKDPC